MALYIPGGMMGGGASGSVGSVVFSHNRFGTYMRTKVIPTNPATGPQVLARNRISALSNQWFNVATAAQRAAWDTYAANVPVTNRVGQQIYLTGFNWFVGCNALRDQAGANFSTIYDAPTIFNLASYDILTVAASEATQLITITYTPAHDWTEDDGGLLWYATRPQNASINFNNLPYRYAGVTEGLTATPPASPQTMAAPFPFVEGQKLFTRFNCINPDARIGAVQKYEVIAAA